MADFVMPDMTEITLCCDSSQEAQRSARPQPAWFEADAQRLLALLAARNAIRKRREHGLETWIWLLDLVKAFDKVPHQRLLAKCKGLALDGKLLEWIRVWLEGRKQRVEGAHKEKQP